MKRLILLTLLTLIGWIGATNTLRAEKYGKLFGVDITDKNCHDLVKAINDYAYKYSIKFFEAAGRPFLWYCMTRGSASYLVR